MTSIELAYARGAVAWAMVPAVPTTPARLLTAGGKSIQVDDPAGLAGHLRRQTDSAGGALVLPARLRPVVLLQDRPRGVLGEVVALALVGLSHLSDEQRDGVREQREPSLFHLPRRPTKYGLEQEMAVDLNALVRLGVGALLPRAVGRLDDNEMRVVGERLIEHLDIDFEPVISNKVEARLTELSSSAML